MSEPPAQLLEQTLVLRARLGDAGALGLLVERWQPRLWLHARRFTGDDAAAWDITQEVWLSVVRGIGRLNEPDVFPAWLSMILRRRCTDWLRKHKRRTEQPLTAEPAVADPAPHHDERERLHRAMTSLSDDHRRVVVMHYLEGLAIADIARLTCTPPGTVRSRLHHARQHLKRILENRHDPV